MAKGAITKSKIIDKILATFPGSFTYNDGKEIRINDTENGEPVQIKITLTCATKPVESDAINFADDGAVPAKEGTQQGPAEPTEEEKERLTKLLNQLGLS